ncbi:hypothetical protein FEM33_23095 [Dyadobacter flavalbus]|uniref:GNAT family N-acetyltransferase n=1 Tax=Dyadobacter flavalbus TaxID=2579942 RepID=A0A5M8QDR0_9BACT|nr:hypothetical protein [Dyadobacter flavalbus]KAA6434167.1 hypothetical protein FEM33_23095 [Dyadobacter flavalbus]
MTPVLVNRSQIFDLIWNDHIRRSKQAVVYANSFYLDIVCSGWKALVWPSVYDYTIVMPLPIKKRIGISVISQPLFCQYLGLFSRKELTVPEVEAFMKALSQHYSYISSYSFNPENYDLMKTICSRFEEFEFKEQSTYWLRLGQHYNRIYYQYTTDRKLNLKRSKKKQWTIQMSADIKPLIRMFKENHASRIPGGVSRNAYRKLNLLFRLLPSRSELWYAEKDDKIHAGILLFRNYGKAIYIFNASDKIGRAGNARTYLLDYYFYFNAGQPLIFDFESPDISTVASFYESFGSEKKQYFTIRKNQLAFPFRQIQEWRRNRMLKTR